MADNQKLGKKLPKRTGAEAHKKRRAASWARGEKRKEARRQAQAAREAVNRAERANKNLTPWELAKAKRAERRAANPAVQERRKRWQAAA